MPLFFSPNRRKNPGVSRNLHRLRIKMSSQSQELRIRKFVIQDAKPLLKLFKEAVQSINIRHYTEEQVQTWTTVDEKAWRTTLLSNETFVAEMDGQIVGFADLDKDGFLDHLYIHKDYQGRFISFKLFGFVKEAAIKRGLKKIFTNCSITAKIPAERAGFRVIKEQEVEKNGVRFTNFLMEKVLSS